MHLLHPPQTTYRIQKNISILFDTLRKPSCKISVILSWNTVNIKLYGKIVNSEYQGMKILERSTSEKIQKRHFVFISHRHPHPSSLSPFRRVVSCRCHKRKSKRVKKKFHEWLNNSTDAIL